MPTVRISEELFREIQKYAEPLTDNFESALWKALGKKGKGDLPGTRAPRIPASSKLTPSFEYWKLILEVLIERGGKAPRQQVHDDIERKMAGRFLPGDSEENLDGTKKWDKQVDFQRLAMVHKGLLKKDSPRGYWEITATGKGWLAQARGEKSEGPKHDPQEDDPKLKNIFKLAEAEVERELADQPRQLGFCHVYWEKKKQILKNKYGIEWKTPGEMNPGIIFD
jgi:hypothetical protein